MELKKMLAGGVLVLSAVSACTPVCEKALIRAGRHVFDALDESGEADEEMRAEVRDLEVKKRRLAQKKREAYEQSRREIEAIDRVEQAVHHQGHIHIHQHFIERNHLSDEKKAELEAEIRYHKKALERLGQ